MFRAPSRRFAFSSTYLARSFEAIPEPAEASALARRCLPVCRTDQPSRDETYPLELYVYSLPNLDSVASPNLPWLNDIAGAYLFEKWRTWVEIHPETAERFGVTEHDQVEVRTPRGTLVLPVKPFAGVMPEVIAIPFGLGQKAGGRWCKGIGENPAVLVDAQSDPLSGAALWTATRAAIRRV